MAVIGGISVFELRENFQEGISDGRPWARKSYLVPNWDDRYTVANGIIFSTTLTGGVGGTIGFQRPMVYPESTNITAADVTIRGVGKIRQGTKQIAWDSAVVSIDFGRTPYQIERASDPGGLNSFDPAAPLIYASQSLDNSVQIIDLKPGTCKLNDTGSHSLQQGFGLPVSIITMNLTLHRLPYLIPAAVRAQAGTVNQSTFWGCAAGKLRWDGSRTMAEYNVNGTMVQDTLLTFVYRPIAAWDKILHPDGVSGWTQVLYNSVSVLTSLDFTQLIPAAYLGTG